MSGTVAGIPGAVERSGRSGFSASPSTRLGWVSFGLFAGFLVMISLNRPVAMLLHVGLSLPYNALTVVVGLIAAVAGLVTVIRAHERSWMVWLAILLPVLLVLAEIVTGALGVG